MLWEEAEKITLLGVEMYAYGLFIAVAALCAAAAVFILCRMRNRTAGTAPLLVLLMLLCGGVLSRLGYCLMNRSLGYMMPVDTWFWITAGGWSMAGVIGGSFLAAWLTSRILRQDTGSLLDITSISLLLFITGERIAERFIPGFNMSRPLDTEWLASSFLAQSDIYGSYLRSYYICAFVALALFFVLLFHYRKTENGETWIIFMMLYGSAAIVTESLHYDYFLNISFVGLEQVLAGVLMLCGVVAAAVRCRRCGTPLRIISVCLALAAMGGVLGLEFAIDRSGWNRFLLYGAMIVVVLIPFAAGCLMIRRNKQRGTSAT